MAKKDEELSEQAASGKGQLNSDLWGHRFSQNANKKITKISTLEVYLRVGQKSLKFFVGILGEKMTS